MDFDQCACSGKSLGRFLRPAAMSLLADGPAHGYSIAQRLSRTRLFNGQEPDHTGLYRALKQMEEEGLLKSEWDLADSGPARRVFNLTPKGKACLDTWRSTLETYRDAVDELLCLLERNA